jgi:hypothetical protein
MCIGIELSLLEILWKFLTVTMPAKIIDLDKGNCYDVKYHPSLVIPA